MSKVFESLNHNEVLPGFALHKNLFKVELLHYHLLSLREYQNIANWETIFITIPVSASPRDRSIALPISCYPEQFGKVCYQAPCWFDRGIGDCFPTKF